MVLQRRSRSIIMLWWWGGSTAAGVTIPLPGWCYELIVSLCDQVGSANAINAGCYSMKKHASRLPILSGSSSLFELRVFPASSQRDLEDSMEG